MNAKGRTFRCLHYVLQCNRIPANGDFESDFEAHIEKLVSQIAPIVTHEKQKEKDSLPASVQTANPSRLLRTRTQTGTEEVPNGAAIETLINQLEQKDTLHDALITVRFLTEGEHVRQAMTEGGICPVLERLLGEATQADEQWVIEQLLIIIQGMTGRPDYLPMKGQLRALPDWNASGTNMIQAGMLPRLISLLASDREQYHNRVMRCLCNIGRTWKYKSAVPISQSNALIECLPLKLVVEPPCALGSSSHLAARPLPAGGFAHPAREQQITALVLLATILRTNSVSLLQQLHRGGVVSILNGILSSTDDPVLTEKVLWGLKALLRIRYSKKKS